MAPFNRLSPSVTCDLLAPKIARYANNLQVSFTAFGWGPKYILSGQETEASLRQTCCYDIYAILLLFAGPFDQFTIFSIKFFSSARYHLSGQVTQASFGQSDGLIALYPFFVFCFGLTDQFATWLGVNIFKCWRTLNFFSEIYNFGRYILWETLG